MSEINTNELQESINKIYYSIYAKLIDGYKKRSANSWFFFCTYYISATRQLTSNLPEDNEVKTVFDESRALIVPTIYMFRHTLELVLKYIALITNDLDIETHNIEHLSTKITVKELSKKINWAKLKGNFKEITTDEEPLKRQLQRAVDNLHDLAQSYLFQLPIIKFIAKGDFILVDEQNELFKYPNTNKVRFYMDPLRFYDFSLSDIQVFKNDFQKLVNSFNIIETFIYLSSNEKQTE